MISPEGGIHETWGPPSIPFNVTAKVEVEDRVIVEWGPWQWKKVGGYTFDSNEWNDNPCWGSYQPNEDSVDLIPVWVCQKGLCNDEMPDGLRSRLRYVSL